MGARIATVVAGALLLAGCGGGLGDAERSELEGELETAVVNFTDAYFAGEGVAAYELISERCRAEISQEDYVANVEGLAVRLGYDGAEVVSFDVESIDRETATVSYGYSLDDFLQEPQHWVREDGGWRKDTCSGS